MQRSDNLEFRVPGAQGGPGSTHTTFEVILAWRENSGFAPGVALRGLQKKPVSVLEKPHSLRAFSPNAALSPRQAHGGKGSSAGPREKQGK